MLPCLVCTGTKLWSQIRLISPVPTHCALQCHPCWPRKAEFGTAVNKERNKSGRALSTCTQKLDRPSLAFVQQCRKMLGTRESAVTRQLQTFTGASFMSEWNSGFTVTGFPGSWPSHEHSAVFPGFSQKYFPTSKGLFFHQSFML